MKDNGPGFATEKTGKTNGINTDSNFFPVKSKDEIGFASSPSLCTKSVPVEGAVSLH